MKTHEVHEVSHRPRHDLFHYPLGVGLILSYVMPLGALIADRLRKPKQSPASVRGEGRQP